MAFDPRLSLRLSCPSMTQHNDQQVHTLEATTPKPCQLESCVAAILLPTVSWPVYLSRCRHFVSSDYPLFLGDFPNTYSLVGCYPHRYLCFYHYARKGWYKCGWRSCTSRRYGCRCFVRLPVKIWNRSTRFLASLSSTTSTAESTNHANEC